VDHWAQNQASAMAVPVPDLNPIENEWGLNWREEAPTWIWGDSVCRNGLWSPVRCSPNSPGIIWEDSELLSWKKEAAKSILKLQLFPILEKYIYFIMWFPLPNNANLFFTAILPSCDICFEFWFIPEINIQDITKIIEKNLGDLKYITKS